MIDVNALFSISYGLYIVSSGNKVKGNGFISNSVFQITSSPIQFAACCNKNNYTTQFIQETGVFSLSILSINTSSELIIKFGYNSGRNIDKMQGSNIKYGSTGVPIILDSAVSVFEFKVVNTMDVGTHIIFIGEAINSKVLSSDEAMTYDYYRNVKKGVAPKNAPTYIDKSKLETKEEQMESEIYKCSACGFEHTITDGDNSKNITPGTPWKDVPETYTCPLCGMLKEEFYKL